MRASTGCRLDGSLASVAKAVPEEGVDHADVVVAESGGNDAMPISLGIADVERGKSPWRVSSFRREGVGNEDDAPEGDAATLFQAGLPGDAGVTEADVNVARFCEVIAFLLCEPDPRLPLPIFVDCGGGSPTFVVPTLGPERPIPPRPGLICC